MKGSSGRFCPQVEFAPQTLEGLAFWRIVSGPGIWSGGGMSPPRLDRVEIRLQMDGAPTWISSGLLNAFEPKALEAMAQTRPKNNNSAEPQRGRRKRKDGNP